MRSEAIIPENIKKKIQLYIAARFLFEKGKSHPQIVEMLEKYEPDKDKLVLIADNAMQEKWDTLYRESRKLFAEGKIYEEVLSYLKTREPDEEIAKWICGKWYEWKTRHMEFMVESPGNITHGLKWVVISVIIIPILFYMNVSWIGKAIWIFTFVVSFFQWVIGLKQRRDAKKIDLLFED